MNTFINPPPPPSQKTPRKKKENVIKRFFVSLGEFIRNDRVHKVTGAFFILLALYLFLSFNSFLYHNLVQFPANPDGNLFENRTFSEIIDLFRDETKVAQNRLGKAGALLSVIFIRNWFGISSYLFILLFFISGWYLIRKSQLLSFIKTIKYSFYILLWLPATLSLVFQSTDFLFLGGSFGYFLSRWLTSAMGTMGAAGLLFFSLFVFLTIKYDIPFKWFKKKPQTSPIPTDGSFQPVSAGDVPFSDGVVIPPVSPAGKTELEVPPSDEPTGQELVKTDDVELTIIKTGPENAIQTDTIVPIEESEPEPTNFDPRSELPDYVFPSFDLLNDYSRNTLNISEDQLAQELESNKNRIVDTLRNYNIDLTQIFATVGPTVTLYEIVPAPGTRISKIRSLQDDIAMSLSALGIRIIAPMPGKGTIGIEVPNRLRDIVPVKSILSSERFQGAKMELIIGIGKTISNETYIYDLTKMPHLLLAGATGQGKSVGINSILLSLLYTKHPTQLKFVMVDPKKVELSLYNKIARHFLASLPNIEDPIIFDTKKVIYTLNSLCTEMENRLELLHTADVNDVKPYNVKYMAGQLKTQDGHRYLPYIVVVIDEFGDLIMTAGKEIEVPLTRLAQLARATGIHLVISTQRPSVNIITGSIKANFPARISFKVASQFDSRTILDERGAEQLVGRGDMLLKAGSDLIRLQCAFVDTPEVQRVVEFIGGQKGFAASFQLPEYSEETEGSKGDIDPAERDPMFAEAARIVVQHQQGSASLLQRKLKLGYNRAGRIIDQLEAAGIIGPFEGSKARQVLIKDPANLERFLRDMNNNTDSDENIE